MSMHQKVLFFIGGLQMAINIYICAQRPVKQQGLVAKTKNSTGKRTGEIPGIL